METTVFQKYDQDHITDRMLQEAAQLFSNNYGIWGEEAARKFGSFAKQGSRVKMNGTRLRAQCLPAGAECSYVRVSVDGQLAGNVFACRWKQGDNVVCWITQLVVHRKYRERGLASGLLNELKEEDVDVYGVVSSHPATCMAAAKVFGRGINNAHLAFIRNHAEVIMKASSIDYIKNAKLHGSLFDPAVTDGAISDVDTGFFIDHTEPLEALERARKDRDWPLGELIDGHEFLLIHEAKHQPRSKPC